MKKFILISHSFKGTLSSSKICEILSERIKFHFNSAKSEENLKFAIDNILRTLKVFDNNLQ